MTDITYKCGHMIRAEPIAENPLPITVDEFCPYCFLHPVLHPCGHTTHTRFCGPAPKPGPDGLIHSDQTCLDCYAGLPPTFHFRIGKKRGVEAFSASRISRVLSKRGYRFSSISTWVLRIKTKAAYEREIQWAHKQGYQVILPRPPKKTVRQPKPKPPELKTIPRRWLL